MARSFMVPIVPGADIARPVRYLQIIYEASFWQSVVKNMQPWGLVSPNRPERSARDVGMTLAVDGSDDIGGNTCEPVGQGPFLNLRAANCRPASAATASTPKALVWCPSLTTGNRAFWFTSHNAPTHSRWVAVFFFATHHRRACHQPSSYLFSGHLAIQR